uniref:Uncharacterized protein n=1 Tax=Oryza punctata TaxID=4537 RepID=A0A0E0LAL1_ORYPU
MQGNFIGEWNPQAALTSRSTGQERHTASTLQRMFRPSARNAGRLISTRLDMVETSTEHLPRTPTASALANASSSGTGATGVRNDAHPRA